MNRLGQKIAGWLNTHIRHERDEIGDFGVRVVLHVPIGFLMGITPLPGDKLPELFEFYEKNEDRWVKDQAWKDTFGALVGFCLGRAVLLAGLIYLVVKLLQ